MTRETAESAGTAPWLPPCQAPGNGADVTGLARMTGWTRTRLDRYRRRPGGAGGAIGVSGGRWRVRGPGGGPGE